MRAGFLIVLVFVTGAPFAVQGQTEETRIREHAEAHQSYVLTGISFMNDAVFMGRRDSIAAPYLLPSIGYYDATGFFADASASYLTASDESRFDLFSLSAGYLHISDAFNWGFSGTAYMYNEQSYNVASETVGDISAYLGYDFKLLEVALSASTYFTDNGSTDFFVSLVTERSFYALEENLLISPSFTLEAGSRYFYEQYYQTSRLGNRKGKNLGGGGTSPVGEPLILSEASQFTVLNFEVSVPVHYFYESFIFTFSPTVAFPQGSSTITTDTIVLKEDLSAVWYWMVGIRYWLFTGSGKE